MWSMFIVCEKASFWNATPQCDIITSVLYIYCWKKLNYCDFIVAPAPKWFLVISHHFSCSAEVISWNSKCFLLYSFNLVSNQAKSFFLLPPTLTCSRAKLSCDLSYLAFRYLSHKAIMSYVAQCLWLVLYIIWISQLIYVKCPTPPKTCYSAS